MSTSQSYQYQYAQEALGLCLWSSSPLLTLLSTEGPTWLPCGHVPQGNLSYPPCTYQCACGPGQVTGLWFSPAFICSSPHGNSMCHSQHLDTKADESFLQSTPMSPSWNCLKQGMLRMSKDNVDKKAWSCELCKLQISLGTGALQICSMSCN